MIIYRSIGVAVAEHNALKTGVHEVGSKYVARASGSDQLITNADVKAAAGIVYSKLSLALGIVHGDVATANKDGIAATPSMRTLGTGVQQAAAGDHTHIPNAIIAKGSYTGDNANNKAVAHGLGVIPKLVICIKSSYANVYGFLVTSAQWVTITADVEAFESVTAQTTTNFYISVTLNATGHTYDWVAIG